MTEEAKSIEASLIELPHRKRAEIAALLIESLDAGVDEDVSELWLDEAQRRLGAYDSGRIGARDASDVLAEIEASLK